MTRAQAGAWASIVLACGTAGAALLTALRATDAAPTVNATAAEVERLHSDVRALRRHVMRLSVEVASLRPGAVGVMAWPAAPPAELERQVEGEAETLRLTRMPD